MSLLRCVLGGFSLSVQMRGKPFPARGSHNTKTLAECLLLKKESATEKLLLKRIEMKSILSTKLYNRLVEADPC